jgi:hypothetical protein
MPDFATMRLPALPTEVAPDGSDVRVLLTLSAGGLAHFELGPGRVSKATRHRTVEEIRYFVGGRGQMWRSQDGRTEIVDVDPGHVPDDPARDNLPVPCAGFRAAGGDRSHNAELAGSRRGDVRRRLPGLVISGVSA